ncbi:hypothetical protein ZIOFF_048122 [Zingiber officinale]|uniref:Uncharacterized protein n=1 Tax=Zingiber officinale TaxID=94328 RepID=A0A8J5KU56_ZINOF|nr:hypothetical protein ZIOFF_048122 [Zingiber officinale]
MKGGIKCFLSCLLPCGSLDVVRVVHPSGRVDEIAAAVTAADVMLAHPNHAVRHHPPCELLPPHARLQRGRIYFLVPVVAAPHKAAPPRPRAKAPMKKKGAGDWDRENADAERGALEKGLPAQLSRDRWRPGVVPWRLAGGKVRDWCSSLSVLWLMRSVEQRKRGTRVVELETKLSKSQAELKKLKERLAEAEAAKVEAEQALAKAKKRTPLAAAVAVDAKAEEETPAQAPDYRLEDVRQNVNEEETVTSPATMDVFEIVVLAEPVPPEDEVDDEQRKEEKVTEKQQEEETKAMIEKLERHEDNETAAAAAAAVAEEEEEEKEVVILKAKLLEKEREVAVLLEENKIFNIKAEEEAKQLAESAQAKQEHLAAQLNSIEKKLKDSKTKEQQLSSQLEAAEGSKATLEMDLKRMKVQIEQWRKAAEAAAEVLASAGNDASEEMSDRILAERCSSMDKYLEADYRNWESPSIDEDIDEDGSGGGWGRRKGAGSKVIRVDVVYVYSKARYGASNVEQDVEIMLGKKLSIFIFIVICDHCLTGSELGVEAGVLHWRKASDKANEGHGIGMKQRSSHNFFEGLEWSRDPRLTSLME